MENAAVAAIFEEMADLAEIRGDNPFKVRALRNAAETIENLAVNVKTLAQGGPGRLREIPGIGEGLSQKILEIVAGGDCAEHREMRRQVPPSLLEVLRIEGVGPKKAKLFWEQLGATTVEEVALAAKAGKLRTLKGMGEKSEAKVLKGIESLKQRVGRFLLPVGMDVASRLVAFLRDGPGVERAEPAGSLRRRRDTIGDLDILVVGAKGAKALERAATFPDVAEVMLRGETKTSLRLKSGLQVDVRLVPRESFGAAMQYFTGSKEHNIELRSRAQRQGLTLNEYAVAREETGLRVASETEDEVYRALGLPFAPPPELREARGEIAALERGELPPLVAEGDLKGDLHMHTTLTDGANALEEMVDAARKRGLRYVAITDHSRHVTVAGGIDEAALLDECKAIDRLNAKLKGFRVLRGIECDILADGTLDLDLEVLSKLDWVIGSVHYKFEMTAEEQTDRIIAAMRTGVVNVIAHPTGRLIDRREGYPLDLERLVDAAARYGVALEINAFPTRRDLSDVNARMARDRGARIAISSDAHSTKHLEHLCYGVYTARRAWVRKEDVLNALDAGALLEAVGKGDRA